MLVDTHAHIHFDDYDNVGQLLANAKAAGATRIVTVGTDVESSKRAIELVNKPDYTANKTGVELFASVGLHPHYAKLGAKTYDDLKVLVEETDLAATKVVAIGECGLDYYHNHSSKDDQMRALKLQIELALEYNLPLIFHVRDAFDDFFSIIKDYPKIRGVIHSFTGSNKEVEMGVRHGLMFGLNGIITFIKNDWQLEAAKMIPDTQLLLETDCPFLAPAPNRGQVNEPANIHIIAEFLAALREQELTTLAQYTAQNAKQLFTI